MSKIALGTVQFGIDYGVNNKSGRIQPEAALKILSEAAKSGIDTIDTASSYGNSEKVIGDFLRSRKHDFKVVSKLPACAGRETDRIFKESLDRLGVPSLYGYLVHSFESYKKDKGVWDSLEKLKTSGKVEKIGFSLYSPHELESLFKEGVAMDIVQFPFSVFDQRFGPYLPDIRRKGIETHVRSVFLQGLVFKAPRDLDAYFSKIRDRIETLNLLSNKSGIPISSLCVNFAVENDLIDKVVVGVDNLENFIEIIRASEDRFLSKEMILNILNLRIDDEDILLPFKWKLSKAAA